MSKQTNSDVDLVKLAKCNTLGYTWARKLGYKPTKYFTFMCDLKSGHLNPEDKLGEKYDLFLGDLESILWPNSVVDHFCQINHKHIFKIANKYANERYTADELYGHGIEAIWRSILTYRDAKSEIRTWIHFNLKRFIFKASREFFVNKKRLKNSLFESACRIEKKDANGEEYITVPDKRNYKEPELDELQILDKWGEKAEIGAENIILLKFYVNRDAVQGKWIQAYLIDFCHRTGETRSSVAIRERLDKIKEKIKKVAVTHCPEFFNAM